MDAKKLITATDTQYSGSLLQALNDQRMQGLFCDVTVIVEDRKFRAHKNILSACSTYFHQLFCVAGQVVELNFLRADIFAEILNYIYTAKIVRVKSDMLDELIKSGQLLGVPFIAELGIPLSHVKSLSEKGKDNDSDSQSGSDSNFPKDSPSNSTSANNKRPETSSFSREDGKDKNVLELKDDDDSDDDVIFCSEIVTAGQAQSIKKEALENPTSPPNGKTSSSAQAQMIQNASNLLLLKTASSPQILPLTVVNSSASTQATNGSIVPFAQKQVSSSPVVANQVSQNLSSGATTSLQKHPPPLSNSEPPKLLQSGNVIPIADIILDVNNTTGPVSSVSPLKNISIDGSGVQKKQVVTFSPESSSKPGEFKIKISDVVPGSIKDSHKDSESRHIMDGKKIITLDTPSEIQGLSTGCKVYANIGEDTYDIVIPIKDEPDEGLSNPDDDDSPDAKRMKIKHDDHYELIVDGRVYYICIVCKRSYVCLTSLRRHFNVHSWEKKYPCRYCERVFPLAEYRTKHEIHHTGERRYQCLTCGSSFINYQVMSSHIKSAHNLDPSGDSKLYRLNPCKTLQIRQYSYVNDPSSNIPVIGEDGIVYDLDPDKPESASEEDIPNAAPKPVNWDDIFLQQSNQNMFKPNTSDGSNEFEFVIPESY